MLASHSVAFTGQLMPKPASGVRSIGWLAIGLFVWVTTMIAGKRVLFLGVEQPLLRAAIVAIGVLGFIAWVLAMARFIDAQDEFRQRGPLMSSALAFGRTAVLAIAGDFLQAAGFVGHVDLDATWMLMIVLWWLGMIATSRYYR